ncbi:lipoprotein [Pseudoalteromonas sp. P1-9]
MKKSLLVIFALLFLSACRDRRLCKTNFSLMLFAVS